MINDDWANAVQEENRQDLLKFEVFNQYISNFVSKYPVIGNKIIWEWKSSIGTGKHRGNDDPQEIICGVFNFLESYSTWKKELKETEDHQKIRFIKVRINKWHQILKCFESDNELILLAEREMKPDLLEEMKTLEYLQSKNTSNDETYSNGNLKYASSEISDSLPTVASTAKLLNEDKPINYIKQSHLIWLVHDLKLQNKHEPIEIYRRLSNFFVNLEGNQFNVKSFLSALGAANVVKKPKNKVDEIKSKIKKLLT